MNRDWAFPVLLFGAGFLAGWVFREITRPKEEKAGLLEKIVDVIAAKQVAGIPFGLDNPVRDPNYQVGRVRNNVGQFVDPTSPVLLEKDVADNLLMYSIG